MKLAASAFALLLASSVTAFAQGTGANTPPSQSASPATSEQCWDMATNTVKNTQGKTVSQGENVAAPTTNPSTPPAMAPKEGTTTGAAPATRPPGMQAC